MSGLFGGRGEVGDDSPRLYFRKIMDSGKWHIQKVTDPGGQWTKQTDPEFVRWMGLHGFSTIEEVPGIREGPPLKSCERCGAEGVELHHWARREHFGDVLCEQFAKQDLCPACHRLVERIVDLAASKTTLRRLRRAGRQRLADQLEEGIAAEDERVRQALIEDEERRSREKAKRSTAGLLAQQRDPSRTEPA